MEPSVQDSTCLHGASTEEQMANASQACTMEGQSSVGCLSELLAVAACRIDTMSKMKAKPPVGMMTA